jgi:methyl-accepting chemotaxis protein
MSESTLPTPASLAQRVRLLDCAVAIPPVGVIVFYNGVLLDLSSSEWSAFGWTIGLYALISTVAVELSRKAGLRPILDWLASAGSDGTGAGGDRTREAFRATVAQPRIAIVRMLLMWGIAPPIVAAGMWIGTGGEIGLDRRIFVLVVSSILGAMISGAFVFFGTKRVLEDVRSSLATGLPDPAERAKLVVPTTLSRKVQYVVVSAVVGTSLLMVTLAQSQASHALDADASAWQQRVLVAVDQVVDDEAISFDDAVAQVVPDEDLLPHPTAFFHAAPGELEQRVPSLDVRSRIAIEEAIVAGERSGSIAAHGDIGTISWQRTDRGQVIGAMRIGGVDQSETGMGFYGVLVIAVLMSGSIGLAVAYLMGDDFRRATEALSVAAERMADGNLARGLVWESEDEMGGLSRAFEKMGASLRATVSRVAEAADRVDAAAGEIASVSQSVAVASADQVRRIQQANELMVQIKEQVAGVSESAQALNVSVEESSSSILELGAAGDELNDTASVLSSKVEEVSGSIEQMVRSVKQVGATTEGLSDAAAETSSSMEEMASAMRAVDNTAELTANLSKEVVSLAETGQQKVSETIRGMEAIRDATDAAEQVIRGLGSRAREIGGILDVIEDVADETNLLALNAAIIAAQAGEHGRAFSVVADEIKELADRVLASTKEIGGLIRSVQTESENAIGAIEAGSASVATGVERSAEAGSSLEEITRASRESGQRIGQIVSAVREQTKATSHVVVLMEGVRTGVEQISTAGNEQDRANEIVYRSAVTMREVAQQVTRTTEEQARGFSRIRESVEGVREAVESINLSLQDQSSACSQVAGFLEQVFDGTRSNEEAAQRMGGSMRDLVEQAEKLREDVARFRI